MADQPSRTLDVLRQLRAAYPRTPFLALGQTIWWDEPMKASLLACLQQAGLGGSMVLGVHDTDYFAKALLGGASATGFELVPHNDGSTRDLWSAAGEVSRLFGAECVPTRHDLLRHGVPLRRLAGRAELPGAFIDEVTEAWGWRGLVYTGSRDVLVRDIRLKDVGPALKQLLDYGFDGTLECLPEERRPAARQLADGLLARCREFCESRPNATLTDLYRYGYPILFEMMLGHAPANVTVTATSELLAFGPALVGAPRWRLLDAFLRPATRAAARRAYNSAVAGSEMYTLDQFGLGALPFDAVIPGVGRGTLRVTLRAVHIDARKPVRIRTERPVESVEALAELLERHFGPGVVVVGKAVTLVLMLAAEHLFVFNEEGSAYVCRTRKLNHLLREAGILVPVHPLLRLRYATWDALGAVDTSFNLPDHMASAFGTPAVTAARFAQGWRAALDGQKALLEKLKRTKRPRKLMAFLEASEGAQWAEMQRDYEEAARQLMDVSAVAEAVRTRLRALQERCRQVRRELDTTQLLMGEHFRSTPVWTDEAVAARGDYGASVGRLIADRNALRADIAKHRRALMELERGPMPVAARRAMRDIEDQSELARLRLVRGALMMTRGMVHAQHRPAAWWFPMADPSGKWFSATVASMDAYTEGLV